MADARPYTKEEVSLMADGYSDDTPMGYALMHEDLRLSELRWLATLAERDARIAELERERDEARCAFDKLDAGMRDEDDLRRETVHRAESAEASVRVLREALEFVQHELNMGNPFAAIQHANNVLSSAALASTVPTAEPQEDK